jgi:hypothetical protein
VTEDRAVQPEAPTTEVGRRLVENAMRYGLIDVRRQVLAIEAEAYRQGWDANTATSFGNRAASQERPHTTEADALLREWVEHHQPEGYEGIQDCSDINDRTEAYLARAASQPLSQERPHGGWKVPGDPSIDGTDFATDEELDASIRRGVAQERPQPPLHGHQYGGDWVECTDEHPGVAQERPQPDEWLRGVQACIDHGHYLTIEDVGVAQERPSIDVDWSLLAYAWGHVMDGRRVENVRLGPGTTTPDDWRSIATEYARLAGSVASPEPDA